MAKEHKKTNRRGNCRGWWSRPALCRWTLPFRTSLPRCPPRYCLPLGNIFLLLGIGRAVAPVARVFTVEGFGTTDLPAAASKRALGSVPDTQGRANARVDNNAVAISRAVSLRSHELLFLAPKPRSWVLGPSVPMNREHVTNRSGKAGAVLRPRRRRRGPA